jgi:hypothetical protein
MGMVDAQGEFGGDIGFVMPLRRESTDREMRRLHFAVRFFTCSRCGFTAVTTRGGGKHNQNAT